MPVRFAAFACALAALWALAWGHTAWRVAQIEAEPEAAAAAAAAAAVEAVQDHAHALHASLLARAARLARTPDLRSALDALAAAPEDAARRAEAIAQAVRYFADLDPPEGTGIELYTPRPELIAWNGPALGLDPATRRLDFLEDVQTAVAVDGETRRAVVVWHPVRRADGGVVGAVRVFRVVRTEVPVRNQFLQDFDLGARWAERLPVPLSIRFGGAVAETAVPLEGVEGAPLGSVRVLPFRPEGVVRAVQRRGGAVEAFFAVLLLGWLMAGLWAWADARGRAALLGDSTGWQRAGAGAVLLLAGAAWVALRYGLLALDVPGRWLAGSALAPMTDPAVLASGIGGGVLRSAGALAVTAAFAIALGAGALRQGLRVAAARRDGRVRLALAPVAALASAGVLAVHALLIRRATLDATLEYFDRTQPLGDPLGLLVLASLLGLTLAAAALLVALALTVGVRPLRRWAVGALVAAAAVVGSWMTTPVAEAVPVWAPLSALAVAGLAAWALEAAPERWGWALTLRGALVVALAVTALTYPAVWEAVADKRDARLADAADAYAEGDDARAAFAVEQVLLDARGSAALRATLASTQAPDSAALAQLDSLALDLVSGSLLASLADYAVELVFLSPAGDSLAGYQEAVLTEGLVRPRSRRVDPLATAALAARAQAAGGGFVVVPAAARGRLRYGGAGPLRQGERVVGWVVVRAEPRPARLLAETPFPRVLVPTGLGVEGEPFAYAAFRGGVLQRAGGEDVGGFQLAPEVARALEAQERLWRREVIGDEAFRAHYARYPDAEGGQVVAVRTLDVGLYDHLYFLLRLALPALAVAGLAYALGLGIRRRAGILERRARLRDKVLNRFLIVGIVSVAVTGLVGQRVIVEQSEQAVRDRLQRNLARVVAAVQAEAETDDAGRPLYRTLDRVRPDVIGPRLGLDLNVYDGARLVGSTRSQLIRQRLLDARLPIGVYRALFVEGRRYAFAEERIGRFTYTTGYEALPDERGRPVAVLAVPTLPEQEAIEMDQARMIAYLFGVLLLLLVGIFAITAVLAAQLTRPFGPLRAGLLAVGEGLYERPLPVESEDEIGELVEAFNAMQGQLAESRRRLAQNERELAWREMARQVAHEIKNPLTPMKLSVQHLRRAYDEEGGVPGRLGTMFERVTARLLEQIDALTRIAGEFSSFARLPRRSVSEVDLNDVLREAAGLFEAGLAEAGADAALELALAPEPLPVEADREELRRVYINLLKNALQAIPEGRTGRIRLASRRAEAWAETAVSDNGTGVPEEARERIFEPNFSTKTSGMGLGLAITKKAVEDSRGEIDFDTEEGAGTTFRVRLPLVF